MQTILLLAYSLCMVYFSGTQRHRDTEFFSLSELFDSLLITHRSSLFITCSSCKISFLTDNPYNFAPFVQSRNVCRSLYHSLSFIIPHSFIHSTSVARLFSLIFKAVHCSFPILLMQRYDIFHRHRHAFVRLRSLLYELVQFVTNG